METNVLKEKVLVLNKHWRPVSMTTVSKAWNKLVNERMLVLDDDFVPHTLEQWIEHWSDAASAAKAMTAGKMFFTHPSFQIPIPETVIATEYTGYHPNLLKVKFCRKNIFIRDNYTCQYCGKQFCSEKLNFDHVIPQSRGGRTNWSNIVTSCIKCNEYKDNRTPKEAGMMLLRTPVKPSPFELGMKLKPEGKIPFTWRQMLSDLYWKIELKE